MITAMELLQILELKPLPLEGGYFRASRMTGRASWRDPAPNNRCPCYDVPIPGPLVEESSNVQPSGHHSGHQ